MHTLKKTPDIKTALRLLKQTGRPVVITRHGDAAAVVVPVALFQEYVKVIPLPVVQEEEVEYVFVDTDG